MDFRRHAITQANRVIADVAAIDHVDRLQNADAYIMPRLGVENFYRRHAILCCLADGKVDVPRRLVATVER